jgi:hypothetical protein
MSGYATMYVGSRAIGYGIQAILTSTEDLSNMSLFIVSYLPLGIALLLPVLAVYFLVRLFQPKVGE